MTRKIESNGNDSIRAWPVGMFWVAEDGMSQAEMQGLCDKLAAMPVRGTEYLVEDSEVLVAVPYRHRN